MAVVSTMGPDILVIVTRGTEVVPVTKVCINNGTGYICYCNKGYKGRTCDKGMFIFVNSRYNMIVIKWTLIFTI
jgi:hypothetical protein